MKTSATKRRLFWPFATGRWPMVVVCVGLLASGCARAKAKTVPDGGPPLDVPAAPPREAEPTEVEPPPLVPLMTEPARNTPPRPRATPVREQAPRQEPPKPAPPPAEPPPVEAPKIEEAPKPPPSNLQTTPQQAEGEVERAIRASLSKANTDLNRVDYRLLNADARTQYDTAKRWIRQADDALRTKNLVFAKNFADKAAVIAAQLGGR